MLLSALKDRPPPIIRQGPSNQTQVLGGVALLRCQASGDPEPTVTWRKNGASLLGKDPRFSLLEHGSLQIQSTRVGNSEIQRDAYIHELACDIVHVALYGTMSYYDNIAPTKVMVEIWTRFNIAILKSDSESSA